MMRAVFGHASRWVAILLLSTLCSLASPDDALAQSGCRNTLVALGSDDGIGGTGLREAGSDDGIGGTGYAEDDDGIGGTGFGETGFGEDDGIGGTGVFGTITGLGSICVNGLRIETERDSSVMIFGEPARASRLGVGHVVWVVAERSEEGWAARSVTAFAATVGRVDSIGPDHFEIDGEAVLLLEDAWRFANPGEPGFGIGDRVAVSGLRRADGVLVASRVERARKHAQSTPIDLGWLLTDTSLARFSIEGYLGTPVLDPIDVGSEIAASVEPEARVWVETLVEDGGIRATGVVQREYPGDLNIDVEIDPDLGGVGERMPPTVDPDAAGSVSTVRDRKAIAPADRFRPPVRDIWPAPPVRVDPPVIDDIVRPPTLPPSLPPVSPPLIDVPIEIDRTGGIDTQIGR